jgi:uncharacterized protein with von Willebrand factor type A (vWA) domain
MRVYRYSRWDGSQDEFSLDPRDALDALTDLMMEGLDAREALEWMRQHGFELGGLDMRVMGLEELIDELRAEADSLYRQYSMDHAQEDVKQRFEEILDREQRALERSDGFESNRMNEFLQRRHADQERLSDAIEQFRQHSFEDQQAGSDFQELLEELDRLKALEEFLRERGSRFSGQESADYERAQEIREQIQALEQMARDLAEGNFQQISPEQLREMLGDESAQSFVMIRDLQRNLENAGFLRSEAPELTPAAIRRIGAQALADVYNALRKGVSGGHEVSGRGVATPKPDETREWEFGDPLELHIVKTLMNGVLRNVAESATGGTNPPVQLEVEDFAIQEMDYNTQTTTILLLDMSWSMSWAGRFPAAKRVALAMDQLIRTRFPRDHFAVVGFSTRARELSIKELPEVCWDMGDPFTNLQEGLMVAERIIRRHPSTTPQILVITDGQPTAYFQDMNLRVEWPMGFGGVSPHAVAETMAQVKRVTRLGITINTFMLDDSPELVGFVERMTQINKGRAFYTSPTQLGSFLMVDYISRRKLKRG